MNPMHSNPRRWLVALCGCALATLACAATGTPRYVPIVPEDPLPPWSCDEIVEAARNASERWRPEEVGVAEILAWYASHDDRPRYVEHALVWLELPAGPSTRWVLIEVARVPNAQVGRERVRKHQRQWHASFIYDVDEAPGAMFGHRPTAADVEDHLRWRWTLGQGGWTVDACGLRERTWRRLFVGEPPAALRCPDAG